MNHFYIGSEINCINISGKTVEEAKIQMSYELQAYTLNLKERGDKTEQIKAEDVGLKYNSGDTVRTFKASQEPLKWVSSILNTKASEITEGVTYNKELLKKQLEKLACVDDKNIIEPKDPSFKFTDKGYVIEDEVYGNRMNEDILYEKVGNAIINKENTIDLEAQHCYINPQFTSKSEKIIEIKNLLNKYVSSKVTYTIGDHKEIIDGSIINNWLKVDKNLEVVFDEKEAEKYIGGFFEKYNSVGKPRDFATSSGNTIKVDGGDYGWSIDANKESKELIASVKEGQIITKEPAFIQKGLYYGNNDIGNTYVEIDMSKQHLWFYKNGTLIVQGDVVTGNVSSNHTTPTGIYKLKYKQKDTVLRGPDYSAPVTFWMPFNGGIGIHDANWRSEFGGSIYRTNGSHGCINAPYYLAKEIFNNIEEGDPVVCYY